MESLREELVVQNDKGRDVTTSLIVARVFGKEHSKVIRDIENLSCSDGFRVANFGDTPYTHPQNGQTYKMYEMTKDGFSFLVMGYTGEKAGKFKEAFINEFNKREMMLKSDDYILARSQEILQNRLRIAEQNLRSAHERIESQDLEIKQLAPDAEYTKEVLKSEDAYTMTQIAKEFGYTCQTFTERLLKCGIIYKQSGQYMLSAKYCDKGYTTNRTHPFVTNSGQHKTKTYLVWTEKGRKFLHDFRESYKEKKKILEEKGGF